MRKQLFSLALLLLAGLGFAHGQTINYDFSAVCPSGDTLYYKINSGGTTVSVVTPATRTYGIDGGWIGYAKPTGYVIIPDTVHNNSSIYTITRIDTSCFYQCTIDSALIPNTVTEIAYGAFAYCGEHVIIKIPSSVTSIAGYAFLGVLNIEYHGTATGAPWGAISMNGYVLNDMVFSDSNRTTLRYYFGTSSIVNIPNTVTTIKRNSFEDTTTRSVYIPASVTTIETGAFTNCDNLSSITVDSSNPVYDSRNNCNSIIETSSNTLVVGSLGSTIPNSIRYIGDSAFYGSKISSIVLPDSLISIGDQAFYWSYNLQEITIPRSVATIDKGAFQRCNNLTTVYFNADSCYNTGVETIGGTLYWSPVFGWGKNLRTIVIGNNVKIIPAYAFYHCDSLQTVEIGESVHTLEDGCFGQCENVKNVYLHCTTPPTIDYDFFRSSNCSNCYNFSRSTNYYVPCGYQMSYQDNNNWGFVSSHIYEYPDCGSPYYDFYATSYGNRLYYKILDSSRVMVVHPLEFDSVGNSFWTGYVQPTGRLVIPDSVVYNNVTYTVTKVGDDAFKHCIAIREVEIANTIDTIGNWAFAYNYNTVIATFPNTAYLGDGAFFGCSLLETVVVVVVSPTGGGGSTSSGIPSMGSGVFGGCSFSSYTYVGSGIGSGAFGGNIHLNTVHYNDTLTSIGDSSFNGCSNLTTFIHTRITGLREVVIPRPMRSVGNVAFGNCIAIRRLRYEADSCHRMGSDTLPVFMNDSNISSLTIGEHVRWIPSYAFLGCTGLDTIKSYSMVAPALGVDVFSDIPANIPVYIPCGSLESYTSRWPHFTNFIEKYDGRLTVYSSDTTRGIVTVTTQPSCRASGVVVATPKYGYHFAGWNDGDTTNPRSISVPDSATVALTAHFDINEYSLTVVCDNALGTVSGNGQYLHGATASVTVSPNYGYIFNHWAGLPQQDLPVDSTSVEVSFIMYEDVELTALFDTIHFTLTLSTNNPDWGTVDGGGEYAYGTEATITATANEGYLFNGWSDGNEENPRTMVVTEDLALTANFAEQTGIDALADVIIRVAPNPTSGLLTIQSDDVQQIEVYDLGGRKVLHFGHTNSIDLSALPSGTYYLHISCPQGTSVAKVVKQ